MNLQMYSVNWTQISLDVDTSTAANRDVSQKPKTEKQTVQIQMRQLIMSCLIWIFTVWIGICFGLQGWIF